MYEFTHDNIYVFIGKSNLIEDFINNNNNENKNKIYLGKFIEFIGIPYVTDWISDGKAKFEYGIISKGFYDAIKIF
jgi:hypothetical protein